MIVINNPYAGVDWDNCHKIHSISHAHVLVQTGFDALMASGIRHCAISNYHPSVPTDIHAVFDNVPSDAIYCPNAEHHTFTGDLYGINAIHLNAIGSTFESGSPVGGTPEGYSGLWTDGIDDMLSGLVYSDGGGITINHPKWSKTDVPSIIKMLQYDNRVLGIEVFNHSTEEDNGTGWALDMWDGVLKQNNRCWGFAVPDHKVSAALRGRQILLADEYTNYACLKAYRNGAFYCKTLNSDLAFEKISLSDRQLTVITNNATQINVVIDGKTTAYKANSCTVAIPSSAVYVRVEAKTDTTDDYIFGNPIMLRYGENVVVNNNSRFPFWMM